MVEQVSSIGKPRVIEQESNKQYINQQFRMLNLPQYASLGAALRDAVERWPNETCPHRGRSRQGEDPSHLFGLQRDRNAVDTCPAGRRFQARRPCCHHHDESIEVVDLGLRDFVQSAASWFHSTTNSPPQSIFNSSLTPRRKCWSSNTICGARSCSRRIFARRNLRSCSSLRLP